MKEAAPLHAAPPTLALFKALEAGGEYSTPGSSQRANHDQGDGLIASPPLKLARLQMEAEG